MHRGSSKDAQSDRTPTSLVITFSPLQLRNCFPSRSFKLCLRSLVRHPVDAENVERKEVISCPPPLPDRMNGTFAVVFAMTLSFVDTKELQSQDPFLKAIIDVLKEGAVHRKFRDNSLQYTLQDGILYKRTIRDSRQLMLLVVPKRLKDVVLRESHDSPQSGHLGVTKTYERIYGKYWWP